MLSILSYFEAFNIVETQENLYSHQKLQKFGMLLV